MKKNVINSTTNLFSDINSIFENQVKSIDAMGRELGVIKEVDQIQQISDIAILHSTSRYLSLYQSIGSFINHLIRIEISDKYFRFLLPNLRALKEIYANILYLNCAQTTDAMKLCIVRTLYISSQFIEHGDSDNEDEFISQYKENLEFYLPYIVKYNLPIPTDPRLLSYKYLRQNKLDIPAVKTMLKEDWIKSNGPETLAIFPNAYKNPYRMYSYLSNYVHANHFIKDFYGTEKHWIVGDLIIISSMLAELIDHKILYDKNLDRLNTWRLQIINYERPFLDDWQKTPKKMKKT